MLVPLMAAGSVRRTTAAAAGIASDTFTRANNASLGTTETGSKAWRQWDISTTVYTASGSTKTAIASNKVAQANLVTAFDHCATVNAGVADCTVQVDFTVSGHANAGLLLRSSGDNGLFLFCATVGGSMNLYKKAALQTYGSALQTAVQAFAAATTYTIKAIMLGTSVTIYVNGVLKITHNATTGYDANTEHGFHAYYDSGASNDDGLTTFDNFSVV